MATLAPELLCMIFQYLAFDDLLHASHTCGHWRTSALSFPASLWSSITSYGSNLDALSAQLDRVKELPASLYLFPGEEMLAEIMFIVERHLRHLRVLVIEASAHDRLLSPDGPAIVFDFLHKPAPILEKLELTLLRRSADKTDKPQEWRLHSSDSESESDSDSVTDGEMGEIVPADIFDGEAPVLTHVVLGGNIDLPPYCPAFSAVTILSLDLVRLTPVIVAAIDNIFPGTEHLLISAHDYDGPAQDRSSLSLKSLSVVHDFFQEPSVLLDIFQYSEVPTVMATSYAGWSAAFAATGREGGYTVFAGSSAWRTTWVVSDATGRSLTVYSCPRIQIPDPTLWDNITSLSLNDGFFPPSEPFPPLPRLMHLAIDVFTLESGKQAYVKPGLFHHPGARATPLVCPRLRTLEFGVNAAQAEDLDTNKRILLAPQDVLDFVQTYLRFDSVKIEELILRRVELHSSPQQLMALVETVRVDRAPLSDPYKPSSVWSIRRP
ncbi:hypothetical protein AURDEDRAFT_159759 [Auricularia subglabra TFB-10046 SS5]|nr:hypothetical protein AURDEDRAFT_159759 [Auricularia subglabra TFB-10046 SS5]